MHVHGATDINKHLLSHGSISVEALLIFQPLFLIFIDFSSASRHQALEQQTVLNLFHLLFSSQLVSVTIVRHDVGKDRGEDTQICSQYKYKDFTLHKLQPITRIL